MGINYYAAINVCPCCSHPAEKWHICKNQSTYQSYNFRGPLGYMIAEAQHWWPVLRDPRITVLDEYGVEYDTEEFIAECMRLGPREMSYQEYTHGHTHDVQGFVLCSADFT